MNRLSSIGLCLTLSLACSQGWAETVVPMQGQSSQQIQLDINDCQNLAASQSSAIAPPPAGAVAAEVRGRQHDEFYDGVDDDVKQDDRQNHAQETSATTGSTAYTSCLQERGYQVTP